MVTTSPDAGKSLSVAHSTLADVLVREVRLSLVLEKTDESAFASAEITNVVPETLKPSEVKRRLALTMVAPVECLSR